MIDTHTHIISTNPGRYPLTPRSLSGEWYKESPKNAEGLLACMADCGVEQAVVVQAVGAYSYDNAYAADSAVKHSDRFVSAACIDAEAPDAPAQLRYWVEERGMQGVRLFALSREPSSWLDDPRTFPVWEKAASLGAHVIVTIFSQQLGQLRTALERFPEIQVSLDHCAFPNLEHPPWDDARSLFDLARFDNLHCKISSNVLDAAAKGGAPPSAFVDRMRSEFGAERLMWGSDFCQTHDRSYSALVDLANEAFSGFSEVDRRAALVETPRRLWPRLEAGAKAIAERATPAHSSH